tara:strand:+ start:605 stop:790 length:186 start_codon:yes stop_codon:yes gene_type:complete
MVKKLTTTIPPLRGPNPQGLNIPLKQVKTIKLEKLNGRNRQGSSEYSNKVRHSFARGNRRS